MCTDQKCILQHGTVVVRNTGNQRKQKEQFYHPDDSCSNDDGENLVSELDYIYLPKNEQKEVLNIKLSDLDENNQLILEPAVISQFNLGEWPNNRFGDNKVWDQGDFRNVKLTEDGKLLVQTYGDTTEPDEPYKLTLTFTRSLTGSPLPLLPEGEGLMVNFRYELELNISE